MIDWQKIKIKKQSGNFKTICPACSHTRTKKTDPCLSVNMQKGLAKCWNCEEISIRDKKENSYKLPVQEWQNHTALSDGMVKWFKNERHISQQTLIDCRITEEKYYQPSMRQNMNNIVFNYFEGEKLVNKKYRSGNKRFTQTAGTRKILYGLNDIIGYDEIYIVEGEMDKLAFWEAGFKNCVSVPNGAKDLSNYFETCEEYLKDLKKIYIAVDTDTDGRALEKELTKRFGKWRCARIEFAGEKDANDLLIKGIMQLQNAIKNAKDYPVDGTFTAKDIKTEIKDYYENGMEECIAPKADRFQSLAKIFTTLPGQLTVVTGVPSHGKSNFIEDYVLNLVNDYNYKASFYSPEHLPMKRHQSVLSEKVIGKPFSTNYHNNPRMSWPDLEKYIEWSSDRVYLTHPENGESVTWKWLLNKFKEQLFKFGIDIFVIDAFNKVRRKKPDSLAEINDVLTDLCLFAQANNVQIFLVAHPTKMQKKEDGAYRVPTLYDVKGSGDFRDQAHNGLCVYRHFGDKEMGIEGYTEVYNLKTKFKHQGEIMASTKFKYDKSNSRYYDYNGLPDRFSFFDDTPKQEPLFEDDNNYDDLPF